jgi:HSP20 family protein
MKNLIPWRHKEESSLPTGSAGNPFPLLRREMNELFERFFDDMEPFDLTGTGPTGLRFDIADNEESFVIETELPGMDENDIQLTLEGNQLVLRGEKRNEHEAQKKNYYIAERSFGRIHRSIPLPDNTDPSQIKAVFKKGVLHIELPHSGNSVVEARQIPIQAG